MKSSNGKVIHRDVAKLREHSRQQELFGDIPDHELEVLARDMEENGQQHPVEILRDGTIVAGHQRVRAAKLLGWKKIKVVIRHDLDSAGPEAVEAFLIRDNLIRRHLTPLGKARCIRSLLELESGRQASSFGYQQRERLKETVGEQLSMTVRNVNRYLKILESPTEVQEAFDRGDVTLVDAGKVAGLVRNDQQEIARRIADGESAKSVIKEFLRPDNNGTKQVGRSAGRLFRSLKREVPELKTKVDEIRAGLLRENAPLLRSATELLEEMVSRAESD